MHIVILDDEERRREEMTAALGRLAPDATVTFFENAPDMIAWLPEHLGEIDLMSLDHDLGPNLVRDGEPFDPGTGRDVTDLLGEAEPAFPVIVHTTNAHGAASMLATLEPAGWSCFRVVPVGDVEWIHGQWSRCVADRLEAGSGIMIARQWHGRVPAAKADAYHEYLLKTGVAGYRNTPGNRDVYVLRRIEANIAHFDFLTLWDSWDSIRAFAGDELERARYYPEDDDYLLEREPHVTHFEVLHASPPPAS